MIDELKGCMWSAKCHACHVKRRWMLPSATSCHPKWRGITGDQQVPSAPPEPAQCHQCHNSHAKRRWRGCERCVWKWCVTKMVCDKVVRVWQSCVTKMCEKWCVKDGVWQRWCVTKMCVTKMVCDKDVCERWCETKMCVKDGVWQRCVWKTCVKDGEWQRCVTRMCVTDGVWQRCDKDGVWKMVRDKQEEAEEEEEEAGGTDLKTRTPHNDVGKKKWKNYM